MHPLLTVGSRVVVFVAGIYLLVLGIGALVRPETAKRFLGGHATTLPLHITELSLRVLAGSALVLNAPRMAVSSAFLVFGWVLIGTSLLLALVPWRLHQRFAAWSVPRATQHMSLIGIGSITGGLGVIAIGIGESRGSCGLRNRPRSGGPTWNALDRRGIVRRDTRR